MSAIGRRCVSVSGRSHGSLTGCILRRRGRNIGRCSVGGWCWNLTSSTFGWCSIGRSRRNLTGSTIGGRCGSIRRRSVCGRRWNLTGNALGRFSVLRSHATPRTIINTIAGRMIFRRTQLTRINTRRIKLNRHHTISRTLTRRLDRNRNTITPTRHKRTKRRRRNNNTTRRIKSRRILASRLSQRILIRRVNPTNTARVTRNTVIARAIRERTTHSARSASRRQRRSRQRTRNSRTPRKLNSHRHTNSSTKTGTRNRRKRPHIKKYAHKRYDTGDKTPKNQAKIGAPRAPHKTETRDTPTTSVTRCQNAMGTSP